MNPYEAPQAIDELESVDSHPSREPIPSNRFMAVFIGFVSLLPMSVGIIFLSGSLTGATPTRQLAWVLGILGLLLLIFGTGMFFVAVYFWRNRLTQQSANV